MDERRPRSKNKQRLGLTRWFVPHPACDWYLRNVGLAALLCGAAIGCVTWWQQRELLQSLVEAQLTGPALVKTVATYGQKSIMIVTLGVVGSWLAMVVSSAYFLHRLCGPIFRLQSHMEGLIAGIETGEVRFREGDQFRDVEATYNELLNKRLGD